jgi:hypothetical protein
MGMVNVTMLHALRRGEPEHSPSLETESSSLGDSSRMAFSDGNPLRVMPHTTAPESPPSGDGLKLPEWSVMNSRSPEWMASVLSELDTKQKRVSPVATMGYIDEGTIRTSRGKACCESPFLARQLSCF